MSLIGEIAGAYRQPVRAIRKQIDQPGEERILLFALLFCFLNFIARLPELVLLDLTSQQENLLFARVAAMFVSTVLMAPLMMYLLAALSHVVLRLFGGKASWQQARMALMWAALVSLPFVLLSGVLKVLAPGTAFSVATVATAVVFLWQWGVCLRLVEFSRPAE